MFSFTSRGSGSIAVTAQLCDPEVFVDPYGFVSSGTARATVGGGGPDATYTCTLNFTDERGLSSTAAFQFTSAGGLVSVSGGVQ